MEIEETTREVIEHYPSMEVGRLFHTLSGVITFPIYFRLRSHPNWWGTIWFLFNPDSHELKMTGAHLAGPEEKNQFGTDAADVVVGSCLEGVTLGLDQIRSTMMAAGIYSPVEYLNDEIEGLSVVWEAPPTSPVKWNGRR